MEKLYSNARDAYITYYKTGYLRLPAKVKRTIEDKSGASFTDIYIDKDNNQLVLVPSSSGDYSLSVERSGLRVCIYGAKTCGIEPGRHKYTFVEGIHDLQLKIDFEAI